jgi:hypothetical protein
MGFALVIAFIADLRLGITSNYNAAQITIAHTNRSLLSLLQRSLVTGLRLTNCSTAFLKLKVKVKITLRLAVYCQSVRLVINPLENHDQTCFSTEPLRL